MSSRIDDSAEPAARDQEPLSPFGFTTGNSGEIGLIDLVVIMAQSIRLLVYGPLIAGLLALGVTFLIAPTFTARTSFVPPQQQQSASSAMLAQLGSLAGIAASAAGLKNPADQYVALLKSATIADNLINRFELVQLYGGGLRQDTREELADRTSISAGKDGLIVVQVDDESPERAAEMANAYVSELQALMGRLALTEAQQRRAFFEKQLEETRRNLTEAEHALVAVGVTPSLIKANPQTAVEGVATLQARVTAQEVKISVMRGHLTEAAPEFVQAQSELAALRAQLSRAEASEPKNGKSGGYIDSFRKFKYHETLFELLARQFELAKVDEAREGAVIQIVDKALPPERKSKPKRALIAILTTIAAGITLAIGIIVMQSIAVTATNAAGARKLAAIRRGLSKLFSIARRNEEERGRQDV
jgi:tyrosine-protein kinase Etk/Wzc